MFVPSMRAARLAAALGSVALLALASAAVAQEKPAAPAAAQAEADPVVARVNGKEIKRSEVMESMRGLDPQLQQVPLQAIYPQLLDNIIASRLLVEQGYKQKLQDSADVKALMKAAEERFVEEAYLRKAIDAQLTPERVRKRYDDWKANTVPQDEVRARHILTKTKEEAQEILKKLSGGAKFEELAKAQTIDTVAAQNEGDLGYFTKDMMVAPFAEAAFAMKKGEVSKEPVETEFGWHVIKVEDKRKQELPTFEQIEGQVRQAVAQDIAEEVVAELRKKAKVETFDLDGKPLPAAPAAAPAKPN